MRVTLMLLVLVLAAFCADAQWRHTGDFYIADMGTPSEAIWRFRDLNGDGDVQDSGEHWLFYGLSSPGPDMTTMQGIAVNPADGSVWVCCASTDMVVRLEDKNGDGDANDAGEYAIFYEKALGGVDINSPVSVTFDPSGAVYVAVSGSADKVARLVDLNNDGDAMDTGEASIFLDATAAAGVFVSSPADLVYVAGYFYLIDNMAQGGVIARVKDLNNDGDAMDLGEINTWGNAKPNGKFVWKFVVDPRGGIFYGADLTSGASKVYRWADLNNDGDAMDPGEQTVYFDDQNNAGSLSCYATFTISIDSLGNIYVCPHTQDLVYRMTDKNSDGDANDAGEVATYFSNTGSPTPAILLDRARDCCFAPAAVFQRGMVAPAVGKTADWLIDDQVSGGLGYAVAASFGNTGIPLGLPDVRMVPLALDDLTVITAENRVPGMFQNFRGTFPSAGQASMKIVIPNVAALRGKQVHMAFVTLKAGAPSGVHTVSQPYMFTIG